MIGLLYRFRDVVALILALLISMSLMAASEHPAAITFRKSLSGPLRVIAAPFAFVGSLFSAVDQSEDLRAELTELRLEESRWRDATLENMRLRRMLGFRDRPEFIYLAAEVIARDPGPSLSSLIIDKGRREGVKDGHAAVTSSGLAGVVHRSEMTTSSVILATDRNFAVSARVERSRVDGIIRWAGGGHLAMTEVPRNLDVQVGDRIVSSGLGGVIPGGLPIGIVDEIDRDDPLFLDISIEPFVAYHRLEEVFVLIPRLPGTYRLDDSTGSVIELGPGR